MPEARQGAGQSTAAARSPVFYGWIIAFVAAFGLAFGISVYLPSTIGLLVAPMGEAFGWTPPQVYLALSFATGATVIAAPFTGVLTDRFGARRVIVASFLIEALLIASMHWLNGDLRWFYARYALFALLATGTTAVAFSALISRWFDRRRGLALGIALAGVGAGGVVWSLLTQWLFDHVGWRDTFLWLAGMLVVVILPVMLLALRDTPQSLGLHPDGDSEEPAAAAHARTQGLSLRGAVADGRYWLVLGTFFLIACATYGAMLNLVPVLRSQGISAQAAAATQASIWMAMVVGRVATGWFLDRFFAARVAAAFLLPTMVGVAMLAMGVNGPLAFLAAMLIGLGTGAEGDVLAYLISRYFGLKHFGAIYATQFAVYAVGSSTGPFVLSSVATQSGDYSPALAGLIGVLVVATVLLMLFPRLSRPAPAP